jgi:hypothetical protein
MVHSYTLSYLSLAGPKKVTKGGPLGPRLARAAHTGSGVGVLCEAVDFCGRCEYT